MRGARDIQTHGILVRNPLTEDAEDALSYRGRTRNRDNAQALKRSSTQALNGRIQWLLPYSWPLLCSSTARQDAHSSSWRAWERIREPCPQRASAVFSWQAQTSAAASIALFMAAATHGTLHIRWAYGTRKPHRNNAQNVQNEDSACIHSHVQMDHPNLTHLAHALLLTDLQTYW